METTHYFVIISGKKSRNSTLAQGGSRDVCKIEWGVTADRTATNHATNDGCDGVPTTGRAPWRDATVRRREPRPFYAETEFNHWSPFRFRHFNTRNHLQHLGPTTISSSGRDDATVDRASEVRAHVEFHQPKEEGQHLLMVCTELLFELHRFLVAMERNVDCVRRAFFRKGETQPAAPRAQLRPLESSNLRRLQDVVPKLRGDGERLRAPVCAATAGRARGCPMSSRTSGWRGGRCLPRRGPSASRRRR